MKRLGYVYGLTDPLRDYELRYVGKTWLTPELRCAGHIKEARGASNTHKSNWIRRVAREGALPTVVVIESGIFNEKELRDHEVFWITRAVELGAQLTNLSAGGEGGAMAAETLARMAEAARRRYEDPAERKKTADAQRGRIYSDESRSRMSASATRYFSDPEARTHHSEIIRKAYQKPGRLDDWIRCRWRKCLDCGIETTAPSMGRHTKATGHTAVKQEYSK
jgi:hypothetical protein